MPAPQTFEELENSIIAPGIIADIIRLEWNMFSSVNEKTAPKTGCQQDPTTFIIMRSSQAETWTDALRKSWFEDLQTATKSGRNLMTEKYARMMESTDPAHYAAFADRLPSVDSETLDLIERIIKATVAWKIDTAKRYPKLSGHDRVILSRDDTPYNTSFETYLRGELKTYSSKSIRLYHEMVVGAEESGRNLEEECLRNTVRKYGLASLDDAESRL